MNLRRPQFSHSHQACYLRETNACDRKITGEHYVSESVLKVLDEEQLDVSGLPWLKGATKRLSPAAFTANCLCKEHNSALSNLDKQASLFFKAIQNCVNAESGPAQIYIFSGHDLERWMLKTLAAMAVSNGLGKGGVALPGSFHGGIDIASLLETPLNWSNPIGMYLTTVLGSIIKPSATLQMAPLTPLGTQDIAGLLANIQGLMFAALTSAIPLRNTLLEKPIYRPGRLVFSHENSGPHQILLSWEDSEQHMTISVTEQV